MKRAALLFTLISVLMIVMSSTSVMAQIIIAPPTSTPTPIPDSDGDGVPDSVDQCPNQPGPTYTMGCPEVTATPPTREPEQPGNPGGDPNQPPPGSGITPPPPPPFTPPTLPHDGCFVTPTRDSRVNVRRAPSMDAEIIGSLLPGVVYPALGYVVNGVEVWIQLLVYEGSDGATLGYSSQAVLMTTQFCPQIPGDASVPQSGADGFASNPPDQPMLCYLSVGYDANFYGSDFDPVLSDESTAYAAFYFAANPGDPILEGTPVWGVVFMDGYNELPPESPYFFQNPDNAVAVASDQSVIDAAIAGGVTAASPLAFPNPNGGVMGTNGTIFYRLSDPDLVGNCGPIVAGGIDDFAVAEDENVLAFHCWTYENSTVVEMCACPPGATQDCLDFLSSICYGDGAVYESSWAGDSCWYGQTASVNPNFDRCIVGAVDHGVTVLAWARVDGTSPSGDDVIVDGRIITGENWSATCSPPTLRSVRHLINFCQDEFGLWWHDPVNPADPFDVHGLDGGTCGNSFDEIPTTVRPTGAVRLISRLPQPEIGDLAPNIDVFDCDANGVIDTFQIPAPECQVAQERDKETAAWWQQVLDLTCPGGWIMATEIDEDGEEIVTDALCDD